MHQADFVFRTFFLEVVSFLRIMCFATVKKHSDKKLACNISYTYILMKSMQLKKQ